MVPIDIANDAVTTADYKVCQWKVMTPFLTCFYPAERNRPQALQVGEDWPGSSVRVGCSSLNIIIMFSNIFFMVELFQGLEGQYRASDDCLQACHSAIQVVRTLELLCTSFLCLLNDRFKWQKQLKSFPRTAYFHLAVLGGGCRTRLRASFRGLRRGYSPTSTERWKSRVSPKKQSFTQPIKAITI